MATKPLQGQEIAIAKSLRTRRKSLDNSHDGFLVVLDRHNQERSDPQPSEGGQIGSKIGFDVMTVLWRTVAPDKARILAQTSGRVSGRSTGNRSTDGNSSPDEQNRGPGGIGDQARLVRNFVQYQGERNIHH